MAYHFSVESGHNVSGQGEKGLFHIYAGFCTSFQKLDPIIYCQLKDNISYDKTFNIMECKASHLTHVVCPWTVLCISYDSL